MAVITSLAFLYGCQKEYALPTVASPANATIEVSTEIDLTFNFNAEGGYGSSSLVATNGTAVIKTNATPGSTTGSVVVTFTASSTSGAGSVVFTLTDEEGQKATATAVLTVFEEGAPAVTAPANTDVTVMNPVDITFSYSAVGGFNSAEVTATNGTAVIKTNVLLQLLTIMISQVLTPAY